MTEDKKWWDNPRIQGVFAGVAVADCTACRCDQCAVLADLLEEEGFANAAESWRRREKEWRESLAGGLVGLPCKAHRDPSPVE
jgi:hypothetical protein